MAPWMALYIFFVLFLELLTCTGDKSKSKTFSGRQLYKTCCKANDHICSYITLSLGKFIFCVDRLNVKEEEKDIVQI